MKTTKAFLLACCACALLASAGQFYGAEVVRKVSKWGAPQSGPLYYTFRRDENGNPVLLQYRKVGDLGIIQGDIVLGEHLQLQRELLLGRSQMFVRRFNALAARHPGLREQVDQANRANIKFAYALNPVVWLWPRKTIPFEISADLGPDQRNRVEQAIAVWNAPGIIRLVPKSSVAPADVDYVGPMRFVVHSTPGECKSDIGRREHGARVRIGNECSVGVIVHEIGHALGLAHEHFRPDRHLFMNVDVSNVQDQYLPDIDGCHSGPDVKNCPGWYGARGDYDFCSIMHYGPELGEEWLIKASGPKEIFVLNAAGKKKLAECEMQFPEDECRGVGQNCRPSVLDLAAIKAMYGSKEF